MTRLRLLETAAVFRRRLKARERLVGTFVKSLSHPAVEVLADSGLDFIVLDAEHAPYGRAELDMALLAAAASGLPALVRVPAADAEHIGAALDSGAAGIVAPHIRTAEEARALVAACRYRGGSRGFSNSPRAGGYGRLGLERLIAEADDAVTVIGQIEDMSALPELPRVFAEPLDACFVGRADLAVSAGVSSLAAPAVAQAVERIAAAARQADIPLAIFLPDTTEMAACERLGASTFVIGSDLSMLRRAAADVAARPADPSR